MSLLLAGLDDYLLSVLPPRDALLARMEEDAARRGIPIVGPAVGRLLSQLARLAGAETAPNSRWDTRAAPDDSQTQR